MQPKFCNKCGKALIAGDKFCRGCGAPIKTRNIEEPVSRKPARIPAFEDVASKLNNPASGQAADFGPLAPTPGTGGKSAVKKAEIRLSLEDMLRGSTKIVEFGTGQVYEIETPPGLSPKDKIMVTETGIKDPDTNSDCIFELTVVMA